VWGEEGGGDGELGGWGVTEGVFMGVVCVFGWRSGVW
jgi:hypothetical protein